MGELRLTCVDSSLEECISKPQPGDAIYKDMGGEFVMTDLTTFENPVECQIHGSETLTRLEF